MCDLKEKISAKFFLKLLISRAGIVFLYAFCGLYVLLWANDVFKPLDPDQHYPGWFWLLLPFAAVIVTFLATYAVGFALFFGLTLWIMTHEIPALGRFFLLAVYGSIVLIIFDILLGGYESNA